MKRLSSIIIALSFAAGIYAAEPASFNAATYNIRLYTSSDSLKGNTWERRGPEIAKVAYFNNFDIFGTQEGYKHQLEFLKKRLPAYDYIGVGREDGKEGGEHSAIFYNTDLFEVLDHGDFWLAEDTTRPNLGWDAACIRVCTWGKFRHKPSGREFLFFNLHMDHIGVLARINSAKLIKEKMNALGSELPTFLTGDFNVDQHSDAYQTITGDGKLLDSYVVSDFTFAPNGTFNNWRTDAFSGERIDHIFVTPNVHVKKYGILTDTYRTIDGNDKALEPTDAPDVISITEATPRVPSDHFPVKVEIELK